MKRALLVSQPGIVRDATQTVLRTFPGVNLMGTASGALSATRLLQELEVDLLLIDANVPQDEALALLSWAREHCDAVRSVAMTMTTQQEEQALASGADWAIPRAFLSSKLEAVLNGAVDQDQTELSIGG